MSRVLLRDLDVAVTVDPHDTILTGATITVDDGVITGITPRGGESRSQTPPPEARPGTPPPGDEAGADVTVIDGRGRLALPGLVNLHTHLPMTLLRGLAEDVDLQGFLRIVWAAEGAVMDPDTVRLGATLGALESLLAGCTTQLDMYFHHEQAHQGALAAGSRHVIGPVFFEGPGPDGLAWDERMAALRAWPDRVRALGGPAVATAAMPHSTYTVTPEHLREVGEVAAEWARTDRPLLNTHVSENLAENADTQHRFGATPTGILHGAGWFDAPNANLVLAHGVHLCDDDLAIIAGPRGTTASVAHCPGSNLKLASGALPWRTYRERGIPLGLGSDGCSSSNDLDMWQVMRQAALLARLTADDPTAGASRELLRAATIDGAAALGLADLIGSLEVGKRADITLIDLDQPHLTPRHDVPALLVFAAGRGDVTDVLVDGRVVVRDRRSTLLDHRDLMDAARRRGAAAAAAVGGAR